MNSNDLQDDQGMTLALRFAGVDDDVAFSKADEFFEAVKQGKTDITKAREFAQTVVAEEKAKKKEMIITRNEQFDDSELREAYETGFIREREPGFERAEEPGEFNPNGPGVLGFNACAECGTRVDYNGLDMDNRKHFVNGACVGFAQADHERTKAWFSKIENEGVRRLLFADKNAYVRQALLSTIQNEGVRQEYENINETLLLWLPKKREAESKIDEAIRNFVAQYRHLTF